MLYITNGMHSFLSERKKDKKIYAKFSKQTEMCVSIMFVSRPRLIVCYKTKMKKHKDLYVRSTNRTGDETEIRDITSRKYSRSKSPNSVHLTPKAFCRLWRKAGDDKYIKKVIDKSRISRRGKKPTTKAEYFIGSNSVGGCCLFQQKFGNRNAFYSTV